MMRDVIPWRLQNGAALLITVLLIFAVAVFGAVAVGTMAGGDVSDSAYQGNAVEALYAAETGIERATKQLATAAAGTLSTTCLTGLATTQTVVAGRTFTTLAGVNTDFASALLPSPNSQCRVRVTGMVTSTSVSRVLHAIVDASLLGGVNPTFNTPPGTGLPSTLTATAGGWDYTGGPDPAGSAPTSCTRAAYTVKARDAGSNVGATLATATLSPGISIAGAQTITAYFNWRAVELATGDAACNITDAGVSNPGSANDVQIRFVIVDSLGFPSTSTTFAQTINTGTNSLRAAGRNLTSATGCIPTTQRFPANYAACSTYYQAGTPSSKGSVTITVFGTGTRTIVSARLHIYLRSQGNAREAWVDNIEFVAPSVTGVARTTEWRDCAASNCP